MSEQDETDRQVARMAKRMNQMKRQTIEPRLPPQILCNEANYERTKRLIEKYGL